MRMLTSCRRTFTGECGVAAVSDDAHAGVTEARTGRQARRAERRARYTHTHTVQYSQQAHGDFITYCHSSTLLQQKYSHVCFKNAQ